MCLDDGSGTVEELPHDAAERLGVDAGGELGERHDVAKEDRDVLRPSIAQLPPADSTSRT